MPGFCMGSETLNSAITPSCASILKGWLHLVVLAMEGEALSPFLQMLCRWSVLGWVAVAVTVVHLLSHLEYSNPTSSHIAYESPPWFLSLLLKPQLCLFNPLRVSLHPRQIDGTLSCRYSPAG